MFKIQEKGKPETAIWLIKENTVISNDGKGDLYFDATAADTARIKIQVDDERIYLVDLTFNQPILLNDQPIPAGSKRSLNHGDQIQVGRSLFEIINPKKVVASLDAGNKEKDPAIASQWRLKAVGNWLDGQLFVLKNRTVIGRDKTCDITIPGSHLSRRHAEFIAINGGLLMRDLQSANGSYVNGQRCEETRLKDGDVIKLDILSFKVLAPEEKHLSADKRRTVIADAIKLPEDDTPANVSKNWVTKPTSIGNRENDMLDVILAQHQRSKRIMYGVFAAVVVVSVATLAWLLP